MSRRIAAAAIRGAHQVVAQAEQEIQAALEKFGPDKPVAFPSTGYYLPTVYGLTGHAIEKLSDVRVTLDHAKSLLAPEPSEALWLPYLGPALDAGMATLFAEELIEGVRSLNGGWPASTNNGAKYNGPIDDPQMRAWGIQLVDGRMPGFAAIVGTAKSNEVAVKIVRELQSRGILVLLASGSPERGKKTIVDQLMEEGVEMGYGTYIVPFGPDTISAVHALGFATRSAISFGGLKPGQGEDILLYNKYRVFAFVLALGEVDDIKYATAAGAVSYGFPVIADTNIPNIFPNGLTIYEAVVRMPFDDIPGADDLERAEKLVQRCIEVRGVKIRISKVPIPVSYGPAFEGERVRREQLRAEFGGRRSSCFEFLRMRDTSEIEDGKITLVGQDMDSVDQGGALDLGIVVEVAGRKMQTDFEPVLERHIHHFINGAEGVQHMGQRDIAWIRVANAAYDKGFRVKHLGEIIRARILSEFSAIVDKVQVTLYTEKDDVQEWIKVAREAFRERNERVASLTDDSVDVFYSCALCQSFAPNHICVVSPERLGLCGSENWLDCKAAYEIYPTGPNRPIEKKGLIDAEKGEWESINQFVYANTNQSVERVTMYSMMDAPMTSCGCFECIVMMIPEANGVMVVSREDPSMTPAGMTFSTLAGMAGGGVQAPGVMGIGKYFLGSRKFLATEGGLKRVVWMSSVLKESMQEELQAAAEREGIPDLLDKIADEGVATTVEELLPFLEEKGHPALTMDPLF
ncbi:MAG: acetyl-CoA decarbonylase/synthase complex subunit alpha/beta [Bacteroidetes bacterium]|nr:acetyl-CoA decarbonylase/synthase complex subunit alpha/beta [Bacteroidota bacterium]MCL5026530.1 acetyl-CoA decarbonylase/synthase complex subunit alpha/beta [Chloroflexota bacterium]